MFKKAGLGRRVHTLCGTSPKLGVEPKTAADVQKGDTRNVRSAVL